MIIGAERYRQMLFDNIVQQSMSKLFNKTQQTKMAIFRYKGWKSIGILLILKWELTISLNLFQILNQLTLTPKLLSYLVLGHKIN